MNDLSGNFSEEVIKTEIIFDKKGCSSEKNELNNKIINKGRRHKKQVAASAVLRLG